MRRLTRFAILVALAVFSAPAWAQQSCPPLTKRMFDSPLSQGQFAGFMAPRWVHHVGRAGLSVGVVEAAHRITKVKRRKLGAALVGITFALHVYGASRGRFDWTWKDWVFDGGLSSLPLVLSSSDKPLALGLFGASYALGYCTASP